jgi:hypothetical protein
MAAVKREKTGLSAEFADTLPTYAFTWPGPNNLNTTSNADTPRLIGKNNFVSRAAGQVVVAPVGAAITVDLQIGLRSTGVLAAAFATVTIPDGALTVDFGFAAVEIDSAHFLAANITQVGSGTPGKNMTIQVF